MDIKSKWPGIHHAYIGILLMLAGFYGIFHWSLWIDILLISLGFWVFADDVYQHIRQRSDIAYQSPLHRWYGETIRKNKFIVWLEKLADRIFS